jgi:hypothetical protein
MNLIHIFMKEIKLTQDKSAQVDDSDFDYLNQWKWHTFKHCKTYYAVSHIRVDGKQKTIYMHRVIMNTPNHLQVDHIDHDGLNCQRNNMRNCTNSQNKMNTNPFGAVKYLGVSIHQGRIYLAGIKVNGKRMHIGLFKEAEDAAKAYDVKAKEYFGEFANLNFK